jgi:arginine/lysine/ornithine decarboxylase
VLAEDPVGRVSADALAAYPPGIPNVLPGELINAETRDFLRSTAAAPFGHVRGAVDRDLASTRVLATSERYDRT